MGSERWDVVDTASWWTELVTGEGRHPKKNLRDLCDDAFGSANALNIHMKRAHCNAMHHYCRVRTMQVDSSWTQPFSYKISHILRI